MDDTEFFHAFISQYTKILGVLTGQHGPTDFDAIKSCELAYGGKEIGGYTSSIQLNYDTSDDLDGLSKTANDFMKEMNYVSRNKKL